MTATVDLAAEISDLEQQLARLQDDRDDVDATGDPDRLSRHALSTRDIDRQLDRYAELSQRIGDISAQIKLRRRRLEKLAEQQRPKFTREDLDGAVLVRRDVGLNPERVLRVNATTVSVPGLLVSQPQRIALARIVAAWRADGSACVPTGPGGAS